MKIGKKSLIRIDSFVGLTDTMPPKPISTHVVIIPLGFATILSIVIAVEPDRKPEVEPLSELEAAELRLEVDYREQQLEWLDEGYGPERRRIEVAKWNERRSATIDRLAELRRENSDDPGGAEPQPDDPEPLDLEGFSDIPEKESMSDGTFVKAAREYLAAAAAQCRAEMGADATPEERRQRLASVMSSPELVALEADLRGAESRSVGLSAGAKLAEVVRGEYPQVARRLAEPLDEGEDWRDRLVEVQSRLPDDFMDSIEAEGPGVIDVSKRDFVQARIDKARALLAGRDTNNQQ